MISRKVRRNVLLLVSFLIITLLIFIFWTVYNDFSMSEKNQNDRVIRVKDIDEYYNVQICTKKFYEFYKQAYYSENYYENLSDDEFRAKSFEQIYSFLDKEYIEQYEITKSNIESKINQVFDGVLQINDIYRIKKQNDFAMYVVYAEELDKVNSKKQEFNIALKIDYSRNTFSVLLDDYIIEKGYNDLKENQKFGVILSSISNNTINIFEQLEVSEVEFVEDMFEDYRNSVLYNRTRAYDLINEETKELKFSDFDSYDNYIKENIKNIVTMKIKTYKVRKEEKYTDYDYVDTYGNQYTFRVTAPMKYTVIIK